MAGWIAPGDDDDVDVATSSVTKVVTQVETCKALASGCEHYVFQGPVASESVGKKKVHAVNSQKSLLVQLEEDMDGSKPMKLPYSWGFIHIH